MKIVIYNNKPIAVDTGDGIDWVKVFKKVEKISDKKFNVSSWMGYGELNTSDKGLFDGLTVEEFIKSKKSFPGKNCSNMSI